MKHDVVSKQEEQLFVAVMKTLLPTFRKISEMIKGAKFSLVSNLEGMKLGEDGEPLSHLKGHRMLLVTKEMAYGVTMKTFAWMPFVHTPEQRKLVGSAGDFEYIKGLIPTFAEFVVFAKAGSTFLDRDYEVYAALPEVNFFGAPDKEGNHPKLRQKRCYTGFEEYQIGHQEANLNSPEEAINIVSNLNRVLYSTPLKPGVENDKQLIKTRSVIRFSGK